MGLPVDVTIAVGMRLPVAGAGRIIQTSDRQADAVDRQRLRAVAQHTDAAVLDAGKDISGSALQYS